MDESGHSDAIKKVTVFVISGVHYHRNQLAVEPVFTTFGSVFMTKTC